MSGVDLKIVEGNFPSSPNLEITSVLAALKQENRILREEVTNIMLELATLLERQKTQEC